jgi:hypothetical protein
MPAQYEAIRDRMAAKGMAYDQAQAHAAAIYNSQHPKTPVTGRREEDLRAKLRREAMLRQMGT